VIARGITIAAFWSGLALWAPLVFPHEAAFHGPAWLAGAVNYLSGVAYVLGAIAMGLLAGQCGRNAIAVSFAVLAMGLIGGAIASGYTVAVPYVDVTNLAAVTGVGMLVALRFPVGLTAVAGIGLLLGLAQGYSNGLAIRIDTAEVLFIAGIVGACLLILALASALALAARASWQTIAVRAAGSWVAAIALIVLALEFAPGEMPQ
jgi:hydrogenase/urease accessory protein HupE